MRIPNLVPPGLTIVGPPDRSWADQGDLGSRPSAVVILFVPGQEGAGPSIVLIRRSIKVRSHKGQIGLPGGRAEPFDRTPAFTALRELNEELGIDAAAVRPVGLLSPGRSLERSIVIPVVAEANVGRGEFAPAPDEVDAIYIEPWASFSPGRGEEFSFNVFGLWRSSFVFKLPPGPDRPGGLGLPIWGLTAAILRGAQVR